MASPPVKNVPDDTYSGIQDFRRSIFEGAAGAEAPELSGRAKLLKKAKDNPLLPIGITTGIGALMYSAYKFKNRDRSTKLSVYLIHTRMAAQGAVVTALTLGVLYSMFNEYVLHKDPAALPPAGNSPK